MHLERNSIVKLTDGKLYLVLETITLDDIHYVYVMEKDNPMNLRFYKEETFGDKMGLLLVEDEEEKQKIMKKFYQVMKKTLQEKKESDD